MTIDLQKLRTMAEGQRDKGFTLVGATCDEVLALLDEVERLRDERCGQCGHALTPPTFTYCIDCDEDIDRVEAALEQERDRLREALEEVLRLAAMWPGSWEQPRRGDMGALAAIARKALEPKS